MRAHRVQRPIDDPLYVAMELDSEATEEVNAFANFLREMIWSSGGNAPARAGVPQTRILDTVTTNRDRPDSADRG